MAHPVGVIVGKLEKNKNRNVNTINYYLPYLNA